MAGEFSKTEMMLSMSTVKVSASRSKNPLRNGDEVDEIGKIDDQTFWPAMFWEAVVVGVKQAIAPAGLVFEAGIQTAFGFFNFERWFEFGCDDNRRSALADGGNVGAFSGMIDNDVDVFYRIITFGHLWEQFIILC